MRAFSTLGQRGWRWLDLSTVSQCGNNCGIAHPHASTFERHECRMQRVAHEALNRDVVESYVCGYPFTRREVADGRTSFL